MSRGPSRIAEPLVVIDYVLALTEVIIMRNFLKWPVHCILSVHYFSGFWYCFSQY